MYEFLTKEQVEKMSDRELDISANYYSYHLELLRDEEMRRDELRDRGGIAIVKKIQEINSIVDESQAQSANVVALAKSQDKHVTMQTKKRGRPAAKKA